METVERTAIPKPEDDVIYAREAEKLRRLQGRAQSAEEAQKQAAAAVEQARSTLAAVEVEAALEGEERDPEVIRSFAALKRAEEAAETHKHDAAVLRMAVSMQHERVQARRREAKRPVVVALGRRWSEILAELQAFGEIDADLQEAILDAARGQGIELDRGLAGWHPSSTELTRMLSTTGAMWDILRKAGYEV